MKSTENQLTTVNKIGRILKFTIKNGRFPKNKNLKPKDYTIFHVAEKTIKNFVKNKVQKIVHINTIDLDEIEVIAELKTHNPMQSSDDRLLNRHISDTAGYMIENKGDEAIYIEISDKSLSLEEESEVSILMNPGDVKVISSLQFALIAVCCGTGRLGNAAVKMTVPQSVLDEIISKTSLINLRHFIKLDREVCEDNIMTLYID